MQDVHVIKSGVHILRQICKFFLYLLATLAALPYAAALVHADQTTYLISLLYCPLFALGFVIDIKARGKIGAARNKRIAFLIVYFIAVMIAFYLFTGGSFHV